MEVCRRWDRKRVATVGDSEVKAAERSGCWFERWLGKGEGLRWRLRGVSWRLVLWKASRCCRLSATRSAIRG